LLIYMSLSKQAPSITLRSPTGDKSITYRGESFVDDTGLGVNPSPVTPSTHYSTTILQLQHLAQEWEKLLFGTGGALNLQKCFWFLLSWKWNNGRATLHTIQSAPGSIKLTSGDNPEVVEILHIEPSETFRTLDVYITPSGSNGAMTKLTDIALTYATAITGSRLSRSDALTSYIQYLLPKLRYQPPLLPITRKQCAILMTILLRALLPKLNINRNTARSIVYGPSSLSGLNLPHIFTVQGIDKLHLFLGHLRLGDRAGDLLHINLSYIQLVTGLGMFFLNKDYQLYTWIEEGWLTSLWDFTSSIGVSFVYPDVWIPPRSREHNLHLIEHIQTLNLTDKSMDILNRCRLYLQVITLADITSADGKEIMPGVKKGQRLDEQTSRLEWPHQERPSNQDWNLWRISLSTLESKNLLTRPLGW
jgi:hypothetical protein